MLKVSSKLTPTALLPALAALPVARWQKPQLVANQPAPIYPHAGAVLKAVRPEKPIRLWRPKTLAASAQAFLAAFSGTAFYAVKANPDDATLRELWAAGIRAFDVASLAEIQQVATLLPAAKMAFMHPIKSPLAIRRAYHTYGVRTMVLDHPAELAKITQALGVLPDLTLVVRLAVDNTAAACPLAGKFGAEEAMAVALLQSIQALGLPAGLSFHVGSQCLAPEAYTRAIAYANHIAEHAGVCPAILDVGGGFPTRLTADIPPLKEFFREIETAHASASWLCNATLWAEPGRVLVASAGSLLARVELRKDHTLYLNDGTYGGLFEAGQAVGLVYPVQTWRNGKLYNSGPMKKFSLFGPTCDSTDHMPGPFSLPAEIQAGDWLEFQQIGAYCQSTRTSFNGFGGGRLYLVDDEPVG